MQTTKRVGLRWYIETAVEEAFHAGDSETSSEGEVQMAKQSELAAIEEAEVVEADVERLREAIASALTSLATGPAKDGYAYTVLQKAIR